MDLALNNLQRLMCHKTQPTNPPKEGNADGAVLFSVTLNALLIGLLSAGYPHKTDFVSHSGTVEIRLIQDYY